MAARTQNRAKIPAFVILLAVAVTTVWPILFVTFTALRPKTDYLKNPYGVPGQWTFSNFVALIENYEVLRAATNSAIVIGVALTVTLALATLAAYAIVKLDVPYKKFFIGSFVSVMLVPGQVLIIDLPAAEHGAAGRQSRRRHAGLHRLEPAFRHLLHDHRHALHAGFADRGGAARWGGADAYLALGGGTGDAHLHPHPRGADFPRHVERTDLRPHPAAERSAQHAHPQDRLHRQPLQFQSAGNDGRPGHHLATAPSSSWPCCRNTWSMAFRPAWANRNLPMLVSLSARHRRHCPR